MLDGMTLTQEIAEARYKEGVTLLESRYGSLFRAPSEEIRENSERLRAFYVIQKYGGSITRHILSQYMVPPSIAEAVLAEVGGEGIADVGRKMTRADQYKAFEKWASEHDSEQYTTDQLVAESGFSYQTTLRFIDGNPHFHKIKKGLYECRDAHGRRESEKNRQ